jgi:asparagine synthase (glutamine-hydrolysing)
MCGIVGTARADGGPIEPAALARASASLARRGPDAEGAFLEPGVALGHRRLSILDLSPAGAQPMHSPDGRYVIVHNGEVYNHLELREELGGAWRGSSDTETILAAYARMGPRCLARMHGMWAFAIWDRAERKLFAARDRMGVKPFFYHASPARIAFASRPRALHALLPELPRALDSQALRLYLDLGYVPAPLSIFASVQKLLPAHQLTWHEGRLTLERYWDASGIEPEAAWEARREEDLLDELQEIVERSVRGRLLSDVPLGAFLSGGIDSTVVVGAMRRVATGPVSTFTIGFDDPLRDESPHAAAVAAHLGTEHHMQRLSVDDLLALVPLFAAEYDEPFYDFSAFPTLALSRMARKHVTVALSGDGGDESFAGYHYYSLASSLSKPFRVPGRRALARALALVPGHRVRLLAGALAERSEAAAFAFMRSIAKDFEPLLSPDLLGRTRGLAEWFEAEAERFPPGLAAAERGMRLDLRFTLPDDYLVKVDVASMAFSLEAREPLLDQDLVEWGMRLPLGWKLRDGKSKYLLRRLAARYVPNEIVDRPKQGFVVPMERWLRGPLRDWALERCEDDALLAKVPLDPQAVRRLFDLHQSGRRDAHPLLWSVVALLEFARRWLG